MNKLDELMEKIVLDENEFLSQMIEDIVPVKENLFTNLEIEANKKQEFSIVVYKKENIFKKLFKSIRFSLERLKIIKHSKNFSENGQRN